MILEIMGLLLIFFLIVVLAFDVIPLARDWASRIHIGRNDDPSTWNKMITKKGADWLVNTPKIKITDNTRLVVLDKLKGNYSSSSLQSWQEAALLLGLTESLKSKDDSQLRDKVLKYIDKNFDTTGQWKNKPVHVDSAMLAYAIMKLDFIDTNKYKDAMDDIYELIQDHIGQDGTVMYRKSMESYRYVDTVGFICPFLITYGLRYDHPECVDLAVKQIKEYEKYGLHDKHTIPSHAYKVDNKVPLGLYGWGRGLGWFAVGLIDAWNELPEGHKYKGELEWSVKKFARAVLTFQQPNGSWNWAVTRKECRPDSSTTATLSWFLLNAANINEISDQCIEASQKGIQYLMNVTRWNGEVDFSQGDTKDIGIYSIIFNKFPFTQGFCIRAINHSQLLICEKCDKNAS